MSSMTRDECAAVAHVLDDTIDELPTAARSARARVRKMRNEHQHALKMYDRAVDEYDDEGNSEPPEIRPAAAVEQGEFIQLARICEVRRVTDTGIEIRAEDDDRWNWHNISSRTAPVVVVDVAR